jgi:hypothetical protein
VITTTHHDDPVHDATPTGDHPTHHDDPVHDATPTGDHPTHHDDPAPTTSRPVVSTPSRS